jgi:hypothetical protein
MIERGTPMAFKVHDSAFKYRSGMMPESTIGADLKKVEYSETEGFQCWFDDNKYPVNGFFDPYAQQAADPVKRYLRNELKLTSKHLTRALAWFFPSFRKQWMEEYALFCYMNMRPFVYEPEHYTRAVKEVYGALVQLDERIKDAVCVILEHDRPYRYRLQDILGCLDKEALGKNPRKEIKRLLKLLSTRDHTVHWGKIPRLVALSLYFPSILNSIVFALRRIDPFVIALDTTDLYNCLLNDLGNGENRYHYLGLNDEGMTKLHMSINV